MRSISFARGSHENDEPNKRLDIRGFNYSPTISCHRRCKDFAKTSQSLSGIQSCIGNIRPIAPDCWLLWLRILGYASKQAV